MNAPPVFDEHIYDMLNRARGDVVRGLLGELKEPLGLRTAIDVGCGLGYFSGLLQSMGFDVTAVDGRAENVAEAARRFPPIAIHTMNVENPQMRTLGTFDVVLCFGLLYHLENPFCAIRNLYSLTTKLLIVESMCAPGSQPSMQLLDEYEKEDQGLNYVAFYPTEPCLTKMLYKAGFPFAYGLSTPPQHGDFYATKSRQRARTMLVSSQMELQANGLALIGEPKRDWDLWSVPPSQWKLRLERVASVIRGPSRSRG